MFFKFSPSGLGTPFALDFLTIHTAQLADAKLQQLLINEPTKYMQVPLGSNTNNTAILLICYIKRASCSLENMHPRFDAQHYC